MMLRSFATAALLVAACAGGRDAGGPAGGADGGIGWVGMFTPELVSWLENENQIVPLCQRFAAETPPWYACRAEYLAPRAHVVRLRSAPAATAPTAGDLIVEATPGQGLRAFYAPPGGGPATLLTPDLFDGDWGYGPYFHETVVAQRGAWVRLPRVPFPDDTWLDTSQLGAESTLLWLRAEQIVESPVGDLYVIEVARGMVRARPEQAADMWCESGLPPPLAPFQEVRLGPGELYTETGHLRLRIKYTRGC